MVFLKGIERCDALFCHYLYAYPGFSHFLDSIPYPTQTKIYDYYGTDSFFNDRQYS